MSTYYQIFGGKINVVTSDPSNPIEGQVFYNTTSEVLKYSSIQDGAWASGGNLSTARIRAAFTGTQTAAVLAGGTPGPSQSATEEYDGTSWSSGGNLGTARQELGGATLAPQTASLAFGGEPTTTSTEEYDGTSWTSGGSLPAARQNFTNGAGTQTSALCSGGQVGPIDGAFAQALEYDGSSWSNGGSLSQARFSSGITGSQTAALHIAGTSNSTTYAVTEEYDGTSWTSGGTYPAVTSQNAAAGTQTAALAFGGVTPAPATPSATFKYDGTSFSATANMPQGGTVSGTGTQASGIATSLGTPANQTIEFTDGPLPVTKTVTGS